MLNVKEGDVYTKEVAKEMAIGALLHSRTISLLLLQVMLHQIHKKNLAYLIQHCYQNSTYEYTVYLKKLDIFSSRIMSDLFEEYKMQALLLYNSTVDKELLKTVINLLRKLANIEVLQFASENLDNDYLTKLHSKMASLDNADHDSKYKVFNELIYIIYKNL